MKTRTDSKEKMNVAIELAKQGMEESVYHLEDNKEEERKYWERLKAICELKIKEAEH